MNTNKKTTLLIALLIIAGKLAAQMGISETPGFVPNSNALLDISSTTKGILIPRITTAQRGAIAGAKPEGLLVYDTVQGRFIFWNGTNWIPLIPSQWAENGTHIYNTNTGNVGINSADPTAPLTIYSSVSSSAILQNSITGITATDGFQFGIESPSTANALIMNKENADLIFGTNNNEKMRIKAVGNVGIGTSNPHSSAIVELKSTISGLLFPRMTAVQRNAIPSPAEGLMVYVTDLNVLSYFDGTNWLNINLATPCYTC
jgi:hypothetical protein